MIDALPPGESPRPDAPATVVRLRPIRTLTIARDLAFRQRAMVVLADLGPAAFAVASLDDPAEVVKLVVEQRADVVVLDVTVSAAALAQVVIALSECAPRVGIVTVSDHADTNGHAKAALSKWGWAAELSRAAQDAYNRGNPLKEDLSHAGHHLP
jgi:DNA-binding NarL/FixJ family response regulator